MKKLKFDSYDGVCFLNGLVFFAPVALLVRTQAGVSEHVFFLLQALLSGVIFLGEIPTGFITDKIGYRKSLILAQVLLLGARSLLLAAFVSRSLVLFVVEAVVEGIAACFISGTGSAYLYALYGENGYLAKTAHAGNFGTAGFIISTVAYAGIYKISGMEGLLITTVVMNIIAVVCSFFLRSESSKTVIADRKEVQILAVFKNKKAFLFVISLAIFSIAWLLINFFYVVKLENCGLPVEWMSLIILSYSAVQMLAEPILGKLSDGKNGKSGRKKLPAVTAVTAGVAFLLFGVIKFRAAVLLLMLILPLLLNLPEYLLMDLENQFVDETECGSQRAATLSVLNMGVNLVEILTLSASAFLTKIGIQWCFVFVGCFLMAIALLFARIQK
ncbi:MFS transporter [Roseburia inulinivorans]|jgi:MFS family permease|uniref:MFS transporter n=1 Tax=Roseburia inulinivorans TaxID=360807 RepID=A0A412B344_9FIRM|nr:MFS transporter [Roseburia inulinivorans]RGQ46431.1 MFS transporter [Roseburia inulinivorans]